MGLEEKLSQLDELIWKQFEKVTHYADKTVGWDKYDLARGSVNVALAGSLAFTIYNGINWAKYEGSQVVAVGLGLLMMTTDFSNKKKVDYIQQYDTKLLKKGMMVSPNYTPRRPVTLLLASVLLGTASTIVPNISLDQDVQKLYYLGIGAQYVSLLGTMSSSYFCSQLPKPPRTSPGKLQAWYTSLKESLGMKGAVGVNGVKCGETDILGGI